MSSNDNRTSRKLARDSVTLRKLRLKPSAIPHVFHNLHKYLSKNNPKRRLATSASASVRRAAHNALIAEQNENLFRQEAFDEFSSFKAKIRNETLPGGYVVIEFEKQVEFHYILSTGIKDEIDAPCLQVSVIVNENLELKVFVLSTALPISAYGHLLSCKTLQTTSELSNILAFCKSLANESRACSLSSFTGKTYFLWQHHF